MENKQTAVEWFIEQLKNQGVQYIRMSEQAKVMEKQQIIDAANFDSKSRAENGYAKGKQYYEQTYGGNNE
jgi:hypothetical protein